MPSAVALRVPVFAVASNRVTLCLDFIAALALLVWTMPILILAALIIALLSGTFAVCRASARWRGSAGRCG